ncbi:Uncharacterised protein [Kingella potus]|uniref:Uncharacterized protein n=1 Tax=Kingella potus TaxID=265175 RepID=A0A377R3S7_9NEIS|nr:Uncharacterised protein [Kingella potus]
MAAHPTQESAASKRQRPSESAASTKLKTRIRCVRNAACGFQTASKVGCVALPRTRLRRLHGFCAAAGNACVAGATHPTRDYAGCGRTNGKGRLKLTNPPHTCSLSCARAGEGWGGGGGLQNRFPARKRSRSGKAPAFPRRRGREQRPSENLSNGFSDGLCRSGRVCGSAMHAVADTCTAACKVGERVRRCTTHPTRDSVGRRKGLYKKQPENDVSGCCVRNIPIRRESSQISLRGSAP